MPCKSDSMYSVRGSKHELLGVCESDRPVMHRHGIIQPWSSRYAQDEVDM